jgi:hypothetical protein
VGGEGEDGCLDGDGFRWVGEREGWMRCDLMRSVRVRCRLVGCDVWLVGVDGESGSLRYLDGLGFRRLPWLRALISFSCYRVLDHVVVSGLLRSDF